MEFTAKGLEMQEAVKSYMDDFIYPNEEEYYAEFEAMDDPHGTPPLMEKLKAAAKERGLWNLFIPPSLSEFSEHGGLSNLDYAPLAEIMGRVLWSPEVFNLDLLAPYTEHVRSIKHRRQYGIVETSDH